MTFANAPRCQETSTTTGTGTYALAGAATGFRTLVAGVGTGNYCEFIATDGTDWEHNIGLVTDASPDTVSRATLIASSTGSAINWGAGTRDIIVVESNRSLSVAFYGREVLASASATLGPIVFPHGLTRITGTAYLRPSASMMYRILLGSTSAIDTGTNYTTAVCQPNAAATNSTSLRGINLMNAVAATNILIVSFDIIKPATGTQARVNWIAGGGIGAATQTLYWGAGVWVNTADLIGRFEIHGYNAATGTTDTNMAVDSEVVVYGSFEPET